MIRKVIDHTFAIEPDKRYVVIFGLSTDSKPTAGIITGSKFTEVDTGNVYLFDEVGGGTWNVVPSGGGGEVVVATIPETQEVIDQYGT